MLNYLRMASAVDRPAQGERPAFSFGNNGELARERQSVRRCDGEGALIPASYGEQRFCRRNDLRLDGLGFSLRTCAVFDGIFLKSLHQVSRMTLAIKRRTGFLRTTFMCGINECLSQR